MKLTFLGTGTSTGIPQIGCGCNVCTSSDPRDNRLRTSALVTTDEGRGILIDCGPDFRAQILRCGAPPIEEMLVTHSHYDHIGGIDDLRPYSAVAGGDGFPIHCRADVADTIRQNVPYCFAEHPYPGVPRLDLRVERPGHAFECAGVTVLPLEVMHTPFLPIMAYRIGALGYVTDCKTMPRETLEALRGVDTLVINSLRHDSHPSHMNLSESLGVISEVGPRVAYLIHLSHHMGTHAETSLTLPENVRIATDGLTIDIPN